MSKTVDEFWMVWSPTGHAPTYRHSSVDSARDEAKRLAQKVPGAEFFVLCACGGYFMPSPGPEEIIMDDGLPF